MAKYNTHRFFCIQCGKEGIPIQRNFGHQHGRFHRKKLYCPHCRMEMNFVECKNDEDVYDFKMDFEEGLFVDEAKESMAVLGSARIG